MPTDSRIAVVIPARNAGSFLREALDSVFAQTEFPGVFYLARAHEWMGELLLELQQAGSAHAEFQRALQSTPNRFRGLAGAMRAARLSRDASRAREYAERLVAQCERADSPRPELDVARALLARN